MNDDLYSGVEIFNEPADKKASKGFSAPRQQIAARAQSLMPVAEVIAEVIKAEMDSLSDFHSYLKERTTAGDLKDNDLLLAFKAREMHFAFLKKFEATVRRVLRDKKQSEESDE